MRSWSVVISALLCITILADGAEMPGAHTRVLTSKTHRVLDINRLRLGISDRGNLDPSALGGVEGFLWQPDTVGYWWVACDHGPWIIGKTANGLAMGNSYWGTSYMPGPIIDGRPALDVHPQDSFRFHPYKISRTSPAGDPDVMTWPADLGAPSPARSAIPGDQMIWTVFNGADSTARPSDWQPTATFTHMPVEIQQTVYAHEGGVSDTSLLANTAFLEWTFINKGTALIESCYVGLWTDLDLSDARTPFGVDTVIQTGYCWQYPNWFDTTFSLKAAGYTLLFGPRVSDSSSTAMVRGRRVPGHRNLPMSSFWGMRNDYGPARMWPIGPNTVEEAWNIARGFDKSGQVIIDSVTRQPTKFPWSGDPVTGTGWVYTDWTEFEGGFMFFTGPFTFAPGDTQWTLIAMHPAAGVDAPEAITAMRKNAARLRALSYDEITAGRLLSAGTTANSLPPATMLFQNFPNPFNPSTTIRYEIPEAAHVTLTVFNTLGQQVAVLQRGEQAAGYHEVRFDGSQLPSGMYFYRLKAGAYIATRRLVLVR